MNKRNLLFLGAGYLAGRMLKKKSSPVMGIGATMKYVGKIDWDRVYEYKGKYWIKSNGNSYKLLDEDLWPYIIRD
jgi:hypothetical protein